jgi:6-hydroxynicotinate 3-monooxygenase
VSQPHFPFSVHDLPTGLGKYGIVAIVREDEKTAEPLSWGQDQGGKGIARLQRHFKDWDPIITQVVSALPDIDAYRLEGAAWMENMTRDDRIAFVGDAAHREFPRPLNSHVY